MLCISDAIRRVLLCESWFLLSLNIVHLNHDEFVQSFFIHLSRPVLAHRPRMRADCLQFHSNYVELLPQWITFDLQCDQHLLQQLWPARKRHSDLIRKRSENFLHSKWNLLDTSKSADIRCIEECNRWDNQGKLCEVKAFRSDRLELQFDWKNSSTHLRRLVGLAYDPFWWDRFHLCYIFTFKMRNLDKIIFFLIKYRAQQNQISGSENICSARESHSAVSQRKWVRWSWHHRIASRHRNDGNRLQNWRAEISLCLLFHLLILDLLAGDIHHRIGLLLVSELVQPSVRLLSGQLIFVLEIENSVGARFLT